VTSSSREIEVTANAKRREELAIHWNPSFYTDEGIFQTLDASNTHHTTDNALNIVS
jgi:hypothetical protein